MAALPTHSHHRAPLLNQLSQHIPSSTAATLLHAAPSTIRNAKRGDYSASDLLQQHYPHGVKRQKLSSERRAELSDFVDVACPTKSGERHHTHHQFTTNQLLYDSYRRFTPSPISFHSFLLFKRLMRVRRAGRYLVRHTAVFLTLFIEAKNMLCQCSFINNHLTMSMITMRVLFFVCILLGSV